MILVEVRLLEVSLVGTRLVRMRLLVVRLAKVRLAVVTLVRVRLVGVKLMNRIINLLGKVGLTEKGVLIRIISLLPVLSKTFLQVEI